MDTLLPTQDLPARRSSRFSRRSFLLRGAQSFAALVLAPSLVSGCDSGQGTFVFEGQAPSGLPFDTLQRGLDGTLLRPGSPGFAESALPWNLEYADRVPAAIARCASLEDIAESLAWARDNGVAFAVRSGGHSYSGFSTTPGLMIDISPLRSVSYDGGSGLVTLGPGARNETIYNNLRAPSRAVTHGRCLNVGVAGLCMGGGIGFNMRLHGLTCDQLVETDILLADGRLLTLSETQNSDLFWAVRGAGAGNFGIHTSLTFQTYPVSTVTAFNISWTEALPELFALFNDFLAGAPRELGIKLSVVVTQSGGVNQLRLNILGQLVGSVAELMELLAPAYALSQPSGTPIIEDVPYWDAQEDVLSEEGARTFLYERSRYLYQPLSQQGIDTIFANLAAWPGLAGSADWKVFLTGGAVADLASDATAYVHREAFGISSVELDWEEEVSAAEEQVNRQWVDDFHQAMASFTSNESYQNFIDVSQTNFLTAYYGSNLERLVQVKQIYDPGNLFNYPQSIPVSL